MHPYRMLRKICTSSTMVGYLQDLAALSRATPEGTY